MIDGRNEAFFSLAGNLVKKTEAFELKGRLIALSNAAFEDGKLVNLRVVPARLLLEEEFAEPFGAKIAGDAESIRTMRFGNAVRDPRMLGPVAVGVLHLQLRMRRL